MAMVLIGKLYIKIMINNSSNLLIKTNTMKKRQYFTIKKIKISNDEGMEIDTTVKQVKYNNNRQPLLVEDKEE